MPYKVSKLQDDTRINTCGFFLPNGFYYVVEMTFENASQLRNISLVPGYTVDYVDGPLGMFTSTGEQVDPASVQAGFDRRGKKVKTFDPIVRESKYRGKVTKMPVTATHDSVERRDFISQARRAGFDGSTLSTMKIKDLLSARGQPVMRTLGVSS